MTKGRKIRIKRLLIGRNGRKLDISSEKKIFFEKSFFEKKIEKNGQQILCCLENQLRPRPQVSGLEGVELLEGDQRQQVEML